DGFSLAIGRQADERGVPGDGGGAARRRDRGGCAFTFGPGRWCAGRSLLALELDAIENRVVLVLVRDAGERHFLESLPVAVEQRRLLLVGERRRFAARHARDALRSEVEIEAERKHTGDPSRGVAAVERLDGSSRDAVEVHVVAVLQAAAALAATRDLRLADDGRLVL